MKKIKSLVLIALTGVLFTPVFLVYAEGNTFDKGDIDELYQSFNKNYKKQKDFEKEGQKIVYTISKYCILENISTLDKDKINNIIKNLTEEEVNKAPDKFTLKELYEVNGLDYNKNLKEMNKIIKSKENNVFNKEKELRNTSNIIKNTKLNIEPSYFIEEGKNKYVIKIKYQNSLTYYTQEATIWLLVDKNKKEKLTQRIEVL